MLPVPLDSLDRSWFALFDAALDGMVVVDAAGTMVAINPAGGGLLGGSPQALLGRRLSDFIENAESWQTAGKDGQPRGEWSLVRADGSVRWVEYAVTADCLPNGHLWILRDVTERKHLEQQVEQLQWELAQRLEQRTPDWQAELEQRQHTELALRASQQKYQTLFEILPIGVSITDAAGNLIEANPASEQILGVPMDEQTQRTCDEPSWQMIRPDGSPMPPEEYPVVRALREQRPILGVEQGIVRSDGTVHWILTSAAPIPLEPYGAAIAYIDITQQKQMDAALRRSEEQRKLALDLSKTGSWEFNVATGDSIWNENQFHLMGLSPLESISHYHTWRDRVHPDDLAFAEAAFAHALATHTNLEVEYRVIHPDGAVRWMLTRGQGIYDDTGTAQKMVGVMLDISDRKHMELALQSANDRYDGVIQSIGEGLWEWNCLDNVVTGSPRFWEILGEEVPPEPISIERLLNRVPAPDRERLETVIYRHLEQRLPYGTEIRMRHRRGHDVWIRSRGQAVWDDQGQPIRMVGAIEDISDRKAAELALQESETRFLALSEASPANLYILVRRVDGSLYFEYVSQAVETIQELSARQILENADIIMDWMHPADRAGYVTAAQQSLETLQPFQHEWRIMTPFGRMKWVQGNSCPRVRQNGEIAWYGVLVDITDRKAAEIALQESESKFQEIAAVSPAVIFTLFGDSIGHLQYEYISPVAEEIHEIPLVEILRDGQLVAKQIHPDDRAEYEQIVTHCLETRQPFQHEWRIITPSGKIKWLSANARPQARTTGEIVWHGIAIDVSDRKQSELALQQSEAKFQELAAVSPAIIFTLAMGSGGQVQFEYLSPAAAEIHEIPVAELLQNRALIWEQFHPDDDAGYEQAVLQSLVTLELFQHEWRIITPSGKTKWLSANARPQQRETGEILWHGIVMDISDRKRVELALEREIQRRRILFDSSFDGIVVLDRQGNVVDVNPSFAAMLGYSREEMTTLNVVDWEAQWTPEELVACQSSTTPCMTFETLNRRRDGTVIDVEVSCNRVEWEGEVFRFCICRDISDRKRNEAERKAAETALRLREEEFRALAENSPDCIMRCDRQLRFLYVNPTLTRISGIPSHTFLGRTSQEIGLPESLVTLWHGAMERVFATGQEQSVEYAIALENGERIFHSRIVPEYQVDETVASVLVIARDITALKRAQDALQHQAERERTLRLIAQHIRATLNLDVILSTAVHEVQRTLNADRTLIFRLNSDHSGVVIQEVVRPDYPVTLEMCWEDECFPPACYAAYSLGQGRIVSDVMLDTWGNCLVDFMQQTQVQSKMVAPITQAQSDGSLQVWGLLITHACAEPRQWQPEELDLLQQVAEQLAIAIQQSQLLEQSALQTRREQLLNQIVATVRSSLDLEQILYQTTEAMLEAFQSSRSLVSLCTENDAVFGCTRIASLPNLPDMEELVIPIEGNLHAQLILAQDAPVAADDVTTDPTLTAALPLAHHLQIRSMLSVSIRYDNVSWGILCLHQCDRLRHWTVEEHALLKQVADQLAIAIYQAELHSQVQELNHTLEHQVQQRTAELQQALEFEALLRQMTDQVRDSLDEDQILETIVTGLGQGLGLECCDTGIYNADQTTSTIAHEFTRLQTAAKGTTFAIAEATHVEIYPFLFAGQALQFCDLTPCSLRPNQGQLTVLACPIQDDQRILGDLWLSKLPEDCFSDLEVRLVQQVANHCAIALRQSRLYQAAQNQVTELERLNRLKDDFLSTVSHELRTPMANIKMATELVELQLKQHNLLPADFPTPNQEDVTPLMRYFQILKDAGRREISLINDLLDLARLDAQSEPLSLRTVELSSWIAHLAEPFVTRAQQQNQCFLLDVPPDLPELTTDLSYCQRIIHELLTNACKYTPLGETISLSVRGHGDRFHCVVCNTGVEISPTECDRIFDRFYRIPNGDPWKHGGTGLGLALVKKLAEYLGGSVRAESADGQTRFILEMPLQITAASNTDANS